MLYKENWNIVKNEYKKWWNKELDKPILQLITPKKGVNDVNIENFWNFITDKDDPRVAIEKFEDAIAKVDFLAMAYPQIWLNLGPGVMAAYITGYLGFNGHSAWFELPHPLEWKEIEKLLNKLDENNKWWQYTLEIAELTAKTSNSRYSVGTTDLGGITDILASLRTTKGLLYDLIDNPEYVINAEKKILNMWLYAYNKINEKFDGYVDGYDAWMKIWCPKTWYPLQADFSAMISPLMFRQFVEPFIREQAKNLDYVIYHLDGPGELPHVDTLLDIDDIDGIQWVPGAGNYDVTDKEWYDLYKKIQKKNKNLVLNDADPKRIPELFENISPKGVLVSTYCDNKEDTDKLMEWYNKI